MEIQNRKATIDYLVKKSDYDTIDLELIMALLRSEGGCPWDIEQTHESIRQNLIEETYEAVEAIDTANVELLKEELGDVMLQVVFHARISEEAGDFALRDVTTGVCQKLIERHPHIFGEVEVSGTSDVLKNWDKIKQDKKGQKTLSETLEGVSKSLPSLMRAAKLAHKAKKVGVTVEGEDLSGKSNEELSAMLMKIAAELDARDIDPEKALYDECEKFIADAK